MEAPLAPREAGDPGPGAPAAGADSTAATKPTTRDAHPPPSTRKGQSLASTAVAELRTRPGISFQELLLRDLYTTITPGLFPSPSPAYVWITPPLRAARFNSSYVTSMLSYFFTAPPSLFRAREVRAMIFSARVPSQNVANFLVVRGYLEFNQLRFCLHGSEAQASAMAAKLREEEGAFTAAQPTDACCAVNSPKLHAARQRLPEADRLDAHVNASGVEEDIQGDSAFTAPNSAELPPTPQQAARQETTGPPSGKVTSAFTAAFTPASKPYLRAALSPAHPSTPPARRLPTIPLHLDRCFRCLSRDHLVRDCRDPICCRICRGAAHRSYRCPMVFPREFTPHPRRRPTIPLPNATRAPVQAVPFSPRTASPPSATPTPPPTPLNPPTLSAAFDPLHMLASSSSGPSLSWQVPPPAPQPNTTAPLPTSTGEEEGPYFLGDLFKEQEDKGKGLLGACPTGKICMIPKARDIRMVGRGASPPRSASESPQGARPTGPSRSPPSPASPAAAVPSVAAGGPEGSHAGDAAAEDDAPTTASESDEEEEISVESDDLDEGAEYVEVWVAEGDWGRAARYAYVEMEPVTAAANPAPLIRGALLRAAPNLRYQIVPSAHGAALLHFSSAAAREHAMALQPFEHHGTLVKLGRIENTDDRFVRESAWLAHVVCWNFPEEHWDADRVYALYCCIGTVREIDPECIPGTDRSCLQFVIELQHPHVPFRVGVHPPSGSGIVLRQQALRFWPRAEQFDAQGNWISYFGPPAPPANGPGHGPAQPPPAAPQAFGPAPPPPPAAQEQPPPIQPGAFLGASILHHGFLNSFPLPRLPPLPILIHLPVAAPSAPPARRLHLHLQTMLLLPWHNTEIPPPANAATPTTANTPPAPPPSPASSIHAPSDVGEELPPPPPPHIRPRRAAAKPVYAVGKRNSERLAAKETGKFVHASEKASQLKALQNSLALCSKPVQKHVTQKKLLKCTKKPIAAADLSKLSDAIGLGKATADALDRVLLTGAAMSRDLDLALAGSE
ncbi:unnamed protein product [Urochloa humidicola]